MGKARKKKQKNADFQKVKLKVGKRKPVGTNVTDTSFKTSSIHIASQLEKGNEPTNKKNLSLKELLTQLNHYNVTVRHEALGGLYDLFQQHPNVLHDQISVWVSKILEKMTDIDPAVRHSGYICLNYSLNELSEQEILPFIKIIVAHICCGLTHINGGVQLDSLGVLDIILTRFPSAFIPYCGKILTHFMDLISKQSSNEKSSSQTLTGTKVKGVSSLVKRELSVDLMKGEMSSLKARSQILERLYRILQVLHDSKLHKSGLHNGNDNVNNISDDQTIYIGDDKSTYFSVYKYSINPPEVLDIDIDSFLETELTQQATPSTFDLGRVDEFMNNVFPVLVNCWVEYEPGQLVSSLNDVSQLRLYLPGMKAILDTIDILMQFLHENSRAEGTVFILDQDYFKDFSIHFLHYFPLPTQLLKSKASSKSINMKQPKLDALQQFVLDFNFVMAKIVSNILLQSISNEEKILDVRSELKFVKQLGVFVKDILEKSSLLPADKVELFVSIIRDFLKIQSLCNLKEVSLTIDAKSVFSKLLKNFIKASVSSPWKLPLIKFCADVMLSQDIHSKSSPHTSFVDNFCEALVSNVWSLPSTSSLLIEESIAFIKMIITYKFASEKIMTLLETSMLKLTDQNHGLFIQVSTNTRKIILEIIFSIKHISAETVKNLTFMCQSEKIDLMLKKYIISVLGLCLKRKDFPLEPELYISFILSVTLGFSVCDLQKFNIEQSNSMSWNLLNIIPNDPKVIPVEYCLNQLQTLEGSFQLWNYLVPAIRKLLILIRSIPVTAAVGLVKLLERLAEWQRPYMDTSSDAAGADINKVIDLLSSVLLYTLSANYKSTIATLFRTKNSANTDERLEILADQIGYGSGVEDDLTVPTMNLLINKPSLLRLLVKRFLDILEEFKTDPCCVNCSIEVLVALLQDSELQPMMSEMKVNITSIVDTFSNIHSTIASKSLLQQLKLHVSLL